jgi:serine/threonine protein kinase
MILGRGHDQSADWWSLGILIFEMLAGYTPFYDEHPMQNYANVSVENSTLFNIIKKIKIIPIVFRNVIYI